MNIASFFAGKLNGDFWQFECHWRRAKHKWESLNCLCRKPSFLDNSGFGHCSKLPRPKDNICHYNKYFRVGNMNLDNLPNYPDMISKFLVHQKSKSKREFIYGSIPRDFRMEYRFKDNLGFFSHTSNSKLQTMFSGQQWSMSLQHTAFLKGQHP